MLFLEQLCHVYVVFVVVTAGEFVKVFVVVTAGEFVNCIRRGSLVMKLPDSEVEC
jgi:hypothetical protein